MTQGRFRGVEFQCRTQGRKNISLEAKTAEGAGKARVRLYPIH